MRGSASAYLVGSASRERVAIVLCAVRGPRWDRRRARWPIEFHAPPSARSSAVSGWCRTVGAPCCAFPFVRPVSEAVCPCPCPAPTSSRSCLRQSSRSAGRCTATRSRQRSAGRRSLHTRSRVDARPRVLVLLDLRTQCFGRRHAWRVATCNGAYVTWTLSRGHCAAIKRSTAETRAPAPWVCGIHSHHCQCHTSCAGDIVCQLSAHAHSNTR